MFGHPFTLITDQDGFVLWGNTVVIFRVGQLELHKAQPGVCVSYEAIGKNVLWWPGH